MSLLDRVNACNHFDANHVYPFYVCNNQVGWIKRTHWPLLTKWSKWFIFDGKSITLSNVLTSFDEKTDAIQEIVENLRAEGSVSSWHSEMYGVSPSFDQPPYFAIERSVAPFFGIPTYGTHLNGYTRTDDGLFVWIAKRSKHLAFAPGALDNLAAGGLPMGVSPVENIYREAWEEAKISSKIMSNIKPAGFVSYLMDTPDGTTPDTMFVYDLELPSNFVPTPDHEEISEITLYSAESVYKEVKNTDNFKYNSALVVIDFLNRKGLIRSTEPHYHEVVGGLQRQFFTRERELV